MGVGGIIYEAIQKFIYINKIQTGKSLLFQTPPGGMHQLRQEGCQIKALDRPLILVGVQFDNFLDCAKNSDAQVCAGVPLV